MEHLETATESLGTAQRSLGDLKDDSDTTVLAKDQGLVGTYLEKIEMWLEMLKRTHKEAIATGR